MGELVQQGGGQGGGGQHQDGGQDRRLRVQAGGVEGLCAIRKTSRGGRHEEKKEDGSGYIQRSFSRSYTLPKEAEADKMFPISPLRESLSSPHPRAPLLLQMRPMKQSEILSLI